MALDEWGFYLGLFVCLLVLFLPLGRLNNEPTDSHPFKFEPFLLTLNEAYFSLRFLEQPTNLIIACFTFDLLSFLESKVSWC